MGIGGDMDFAVISRESFSKMARDCGISPKLVLSRLDAMGLRIVAAAERIAAECVVPWPSAIYGKIVETIKAHAMHVRGD